MAKSPVNLLSALKLLAVLSLAAIAFIMWWPQRYFMGVDLSAHGLQAGAFVMCTFFWVILRGTRLRHDAYSEFRSNFLTLDACTIGFNIARIVVELVVLAAVLEIGQDFLPNRVTALDDFFHTALAVITIGGFTYGLMAIALRTSLGSRILGFWVNLE